MATLRPDEAADETGPVGPVRMCVGCRKRRAQTQLVRVAVAPGGILVIDRYAAGRGAWLCSGSAACLTLALKRRSFEAALKHKLDPGAGSGLREAFGAAALDVADSKPVGRPPGKQQTKG